MKEDLEKNSTPYSETNSESQVTEEVSTDQEFEKLRSELATIKQQLEEAQQENLRRIAEYQTLQRRKNQEINEIKKYGAESLMKALIPALQDFDRILSHSETASEQALREALQMLHQKVENILQQNGLKKIAPNVGDKFDPNLHDAIAQVATNEAPDQSITVIAEKGWMLYDRLLQAAKVIVAVSPKVDTSEDIQQTDQETTEKTSEESE